MTFRVARTIWLPVAAVLAALVMSAAPARAEFGVAPGSFFARTHQPVGSSVPQGSIGGTPPLWEPARSIGRQWNEGILAAPIVTQAGAHPDASTSFAMNERLDTNLGTNLSATVPDGNLRDLVAKLPAGFLGDPQAIPACSTSAFDVSSGFHGLSGECSPASQVGIAMSQINAAGGTMLTVFEPVYALTAPPGAPAAFGFRIATPFFVVLVKLVASIRNGADYGVDVTAEDTPTTGPIYDSAVTIWGDPDSAVHNVQRYNPESGKWGAAPTAPAPKPFLTNPTYCDSGPLNTSLEVNSWQDPERWLPEDPADPSYNSASPAPTGCASLRFGGPGAPVSLTAQPETRAADTPAGYQVNLSLPYSEDPEGHANPTLRDTKVTLPEGVVVNPSSAGGLGACGAQQIGLLGVEFPAPAPIHFTPGPSECPGSSKIGSVEVHTPLLDHAVKGSVYLAKPYDNPFHSLLALYIELNDPQDGIVAKLAGRVEADPQTGQLTTTFEDSPQLPFTELELQLNSGPRAPLINPQTCGVKTTTTELTPWSAPYTPAVTSSDSFAVEGGANGSSCVGSEAEEPNSPSFEAGTVNPAAGAFSPFVFSLARQDGSQRLRAVGVVLPPGLLGRIAGVEECSEAAIALAKSREGVLGDGALEQASPSCPAGSLLGTASVAAGAGSDPYHVTGEVYFAGPYEGAPFSLVIVTPAVAGPFDLGTVVVRAALFVDPRTAQVRVESDPIPSILEGIPLDIRSIDVDVSRQDFTLNPTSCTPMQIEGAVTSAQGATANVSSRFQAANCASLKFTPKFSASTSARTSKAGGASLTTQVVEPSEPQGSQANIARVKVELPKALPSRLTTLQKACLAAQFEADPAGCPAASMIGTASVDTPILPVPLSGPAIFVSHGGEAFPSLTLVLQGDGVTIDLVGATFISKAGITSTTFKTVPDAPFSTFALTLPEGRYSALAANGNLCAKKLVMPTEFVAQNGAQIKQSTPIEVEGCSNALSFVSHKIKKRTLTVSVYAPAAGRLTVGGMGVGKKAKTVKQRGAVTLKVKQKRAGRLKTTVRATFTPSTGKDRKKQVKSLKVKFRK